MAVEHVCPDDALHRVWFYRPSFVFRTIFRIFRLWVPKETRCKFVLVNEGEEHHHFLAVDPANQHGCAPEVLPVELGGTGPPLDGDRFLERAVELYDATAQLPALPRSAADSTANPSNRQQQANAEKPAASQPETGWFLCKCLARPMRNRERG